MAINAEVNSSAVIASVMRVGAVATLQQLPELEPLRGCLEEIQAVDQRLNDLEREAGDLSRRLNELGAEIADRLENAA